MYNGDCEINVNTLPEPSVNRKPRSIGELVMTRVDPVLRERAGMKADILRHWRQIAGADLADHCVPREVRWKRSRHDIHETGDIQEPGTLIIVASGIWALRIQHTTGEIITRINAYFGYPAIERITIEQRGDITSSRKAQLAHSRPATRATKGTPIPKNIEDKLAHVEDESLRETLRRLAHAMKGEERH